MIKMYHKIELFPLLFGAGASFFALELLEKIVITTLAMLVGTTISFFWKKYLENKNK